MISILFLMLYLLIRVLPAGSGGNMAMQFISTRSFSPALKVLGETGNPSRCVPFRGWLQLHLQQRWSSGINPSRILTCCILAWLTAVLSSLPFGELWPGSWALSAYQLPSSSERQCEFHRSGFLQASWNHWCVEDVWRIILNLAFEFPDCMLRYRGWTSTVWFHGFTPVILNYLLTQT